MATHESYENALQMNSWRLGRTEVELSKRIGDMKAADHMVLNEEQESRSHHTCAVVVQDLATPWIQSYPLPNQISSGDDDKSSNILYFRRKSKIHLYRQFGGIYQSLRRAELESWKVYKAQIGHKWNCRTTCTTSERRHFVSIREILTARRLVGKSHGVSLLDLLADSQTPYERRFNSPCEGTIILHLEQKKCLSSIIKIPRSSATVWFKSPSWNIHRATPWTLEASWTGHLLTVGRSANNSTFWNSRKKDSNLKRWDIQKKETLNSYSLAGCATYCKKDSRYPPLCTKWEATSGENLNATLGEARDLDPRCWSSTRFLEYYGRLHVSESCCSKDETHVPKDNFPIPLIFKNVHKQSSKSIHVRYETNIDGDQSLSEPWICKQYTALRTCHTQTLFRLRLKIA